MSIAPTRWPVKPGHEFAQMFSHCTLSSRRTGKSLKARLIAMPSNTVDLPFRAPTHPPAEPPAPRLLTESDAVDIWIARWLRVRRIEILRRYGCDPRRLYEIWEGRRFPAARDRARKVFAERYPELMDRTDFGNHKVIPRSNNAPGQLNLFDNP